MIKVKILFLILCLLFINLSVFGQSEQKNKNSDQTEGTIKISSFLVNLPIVVSDKQNRYISNLTKEDLVVYENNVKQEITFFSSEKVPCQVILLLDCSGSTDATISSIKSAAIELVKNLREQDQVMVISFADVITTNQSFTSDKEKLTKAINSISAEGSTKLYESVFLVTRNILSKITGRKALVVLTDAEDTTSDRSRQEAIDRLVESGGLVYAVQYPTNSNNYVLSASTDVQSNPGQSLPIDDFVVDTGFLTTITEVTGGRYYKSDIGNLEVPMRNIVEELRNVYVVGYYPSNPIENKGYRKIKVKPREDLKAAVRCRGGYDATKVAKTLAQTTSTESQ